jgi:hypothetical protein
MTSKDTQAPAAEPVEGLQEECRVTAGESPESGAEVAANPEAKPAVECGAAQEPEALPERETTPGVEAIAAEARALERQRICRILQSAEAHGREGLAGHLATKTAMSAEDAIEMLKLAPRQGSTATGLLALVGRNNGGDERGSDA